MKNLIAKNFIASSIMLSAFLLSGCKEEGCMDPDSKTFNADADKDDGSCKYEASLVIFYKENTSANLASEGSTALTYYVNGSIIGSSAVDVFYTSAPSCGANGSISKTIDLGSEKTKSVSYKVIDDFDNIISEGSITLRANTCQPLELIY